MRVIWLLLFACAAACSGSDQSLGDTKPGPGPIDPEPPDPKPQPPNPGPIPACEDANLHERVGECVALGSCADVILNAGYECDSTHVCCDRGVGCGAPPAPCGSASGGTGMASGGAAGEPSAGAGGS